MHAMTVLGAGSWGTALSVHLARAGRSVRLWARDPQLVDAMVATRANARYLPGVTLPPGVTPMAALGPALDGAGFVIVAVPSHGVRAVVRAAAPFIAPDAIVVSTTKGLEVETLDRMSDVIAEETAARLPVVVLSGPSFAAEVARGLPAAVLAASSHRRGGGASPGAVPRSGPAAVRQRRRAPGSRSAARSRTSSPLPRASWTASASGTTPWRR